MVTPKTTITPYRVASSFLGIKEVKGALDNPIILTMLTLDNSWPKNDEVPWCSAFVNYVMHLCGLPRTRSLAARSWARMVYPNIPIDKASQGWDIVVLNRGGPQDATKDGPGHVGFFSGLSSDGGNIYILGGNQSDSVSIQPYKKSNILKILRIGAV